MPIEVEIPDLGTSVEFPDSMPMADINQAIKQKVVPQMLQKRYDAIGLEPVAHQEPATFTERPVEPSSIEAPAPKPDFGPSAAELEGIPSPGDLYDFVKKPLVKLPVIPPGVVAGALTQLGLPITSKTMEVGQQFADRLAENIEGFTTPENATLMVAMGGLPAAVNRLIGAGFGGMMLGSGAVEAVEGRPGAAAADVLMGVPMVAAAIKGAPSAKPEIEATASRATEAGMSKSAEVLKEISKEEAPAEPPEPAKGAVPDQPVESPEFQQRALAVEKSDHPTLPDDALKTIVQDEIKADPEGYKKAVDAESPSVEPAAPAPVEPPVPTVQQPGAPPYQRGMEIEKEFGLGAADAHFFNVAIEAVAANPGKWTTLAEGVQKEAMRAAVAAQGSLAKTGDLSLAKRIAERYLKNPSAPAPEVKAGRETIEPSKDTIIGKNASGELLYQRQDGSVYRWRNDRQSTRPSGYPDFGGDISPVAEVKAEAPKGKRGVTLKVQNPYGLAPENEKILTVTGSVIKLQAAPDLEFFIYKQSGNGYWRVVEKNTGQGIGDATAKTRAEAIQKAESNVAKVGPEKMQQYVDEATWMNAEKPAPKEAPKAEAAKEPAEPAAGMEGMRPGPGAASPMEFQQRARTPAEAVEGSIPPGDNPPVAIEPADLTPGGVDVVRKIKDYQSQNVVNSPQWLFYFGRLGEFARQAWEKMALTEFRMRENIRRDVQTYVQEPIKNLPKEYHKEGGKVFFDLLDGKTLDQIAVELADKPGAASIYKQAELVKTRLEQIRSTIRDTKRDSYSTFLMGMDRESLAELFRKNVDDSLDTTKYRKQDFADALTLDQFPDDWGIADGSYMPHLFMGDWRVNVKLPGADGTQFILRANTVAEAKARIFDVVKKNPEMAGADFTIDSTPIIPADMVRLGDRRFWQMLGQLKDKMNAESTAEAREAIQGIIGRKASKQKWFGSLLERKGAPNYETEYSKSMTAYLYGFHRWLELSKLNKEVQPLIEQVRKEGRKDAALRLESLLDKLWGKPARSSILFDNLISQVPGLRDITKPLLLDRLSRGVRSIAVNLMLRTPRFFFVNRLQPLQGLYPLVGERIFVQAKAMQHSAEGRALLNEGGVNFDPAQYAETSRFSTAKDFLARFTGEQSNQELAFLAMYQFAREKGLAHGDAINYGKLRGQLMTQFTPLIVDTPELLEGPFRSLFFQYKRFPIKQAELLGQLVKDRNAPGIVRMLGSFALLGGASFYIRQAWSDPEKKRQAQEWFEEQLGEQGAKIAMFGLPGFIGADLSGSLVLGDEPYGSTIYERSARMLAGPVISSATEMATRAATPYREPLEPTQKVVEALRRFPTTKPLAALYDLLTGETDVRTQTGQIAGRKTLTDAILELGSFRSADQSILQNAVSGLMQIQEEERKMLNDYYVNRNYDAIQAFNERWPEARITGEQLRNYIDMRERRSKETRGEKALGKKFEKVLPEQAK